MIARRIFLAALVALAGCAVFEPPVITAGQTECTGGAATCAEFARIAATLQTPAMHDAICAAGADTAECRK